MYISKNDAKLYLLVGYLAFNFVYIFIRLVMFYFYFSSELLLFIYQLTTIFLATAALVCCFVRDRSLWYLIFYSIIMLPLTYFVNYCKVSIGLIGTGSSLSELLTINAVTLAYTLAGFVFALFLFHKTILQRFKVERVNFLAILLPIILIIVYNILAV